MPESRKRRVLVTAAVLVIVLGVAAFAWVRHNRYAGLRNVLSHQANRYLRQQLGADASVEDIVVGWNTVKITNLRLPLDDRGSYLLVPRAVAGVRPLDIVSSPRDFSRMLRSLQIHGALLTIAAPASQPVPEEPGELLKFQVPTVLYSVLTRFDSVSTFEMDSARISYTKAGREITIAQDLSLSAKRIGRGNFTVTGSGSYAADDRATFSISGELSGQKRTFDIALLANIPPGSLAFLRGDLQRLRTGGGTVSITATTKGDSAQIAIASAIKDVSWRVGEKDIHVQRLHAATVGDTLRADSLAVESPYGDALLSGGLFLRTGELNFNGTGKVRFADTVDLDFRLCGPVSQPTLSFSAPTMRVAGRQFEHISGELSYSADEVRVSSLEFRDEFGWGQLRGSVRLDSTLIWHGAGRFVLDSTLVARTWHPRFQIIEIEADGNHHEFFPRAQALSPNGTRLADIVLRREGSDWLVEVTDASGNSGTAHVTSSAQRTTVALGNGQVVSRALLQTPEGFLDPFTALSATFEGNADSGQVRLYSTLAEDSLQLLPRILRNIDFTGRYDRPSDGRTDFSGEWSGMDGDGRPFRGSASVGLYDQVLTINRLLVDEAGTGSGAIDFARRNLHLEFDVTSLPFDRLPLMPLLARRARIMGRASGHFTVSGDLNAPEWTARLSVAEGTVLGVPGYWINLDAAGKAARVELKQFEIGRDVQRILAADGWLDAAKDEVAITAETGSARAEDFVLALTGQSGILTGVLDGRAAISGRLSRPDVEADCRISDGLLFNEIHFNSLDLTGQVSVPEDSAPVVRIPKFELIESGRYAFSGYAESGLSDGSPLRGHLQGGGDLLNLLDQLDRSFHSTGSFGGFAFDLGGTINHPALLNAYLNVDHGEFTYYPACPVPLDTRIAVNIGSSGVVENGLISVQNGDQWLTLTAGAAVAGAHPNLRPIVLSGVGANLGVIEFRTGPQGMPIRLPGLMKPGWVGQLMTGAASVDPITLSLGTDTTLYIAGDIVMHNARVTFPFVGGGGGPMRPVTRWLVDRLEEARWALNVHVGSGNHYDVEITGLRNSELFAGLRDSPIFSTLADYLDHLSIDTVIEPTDKPLEVRETVSDSSFYLNGRLTSSHGRVDYLDQQFRIDYAFCDFDETNIMPVLEGRASTFGTDTLGQRVPVYLTMYVIDRETQTRQRRGRLDELTFVLEDASGSPPENVLALLGYDVGHAGGKAQQVVTSSIVRAVGRQWLDPIERRIERWTPLDEFTISPAGGRSTSVARLQRQRVAKDSLQSSSVVRFFTGSQLTVGKYLSSDMFVTYTGELAESETAPESGRLSLVHLWNLEYRIKPLSPDLVVDFAVEYDEFERKRDESVSLKYSFALEP